MSNGPVIGAHGRWFAVLPDREPSHAVARRLLPYACRTLLHASGRPWLVGCWDDGPGDAVMATAGGTRLAVIGPSAVTTGDLTVRGLAAADGAPGSFHLLASTDGEVYARGTATGSRLLYTANVGGVTVLTDRARTLAWLTGARPDPARLAARMLLPEPPYPIEALPMWHGVELVPPGHTVRLRPDGGTRIERWWHAPPSDLPLAQAAPLLRDALRAAVGVRVRRRGEVWGADLSGGMDSTSLCFLAQEAGARLVAVTLEWSAAANEDGRYAREAARGLPGITHLVFPSSGIPGHFTGLGTRHPPGDEPSVLLRDRAQQVLLARLLRDHGARRRLSGHGGDHVVTPHPAYVHSLLRRRPLTGLAHAAAHRSRGHWPLGAVTRELASRRPLDAWLTGQADALETVRRGDHPRFGWGPCLAVPPWATPRARELAAGLLRETALRLEPLAPDRGTHGWVHLARRAGTVAGRLAEFGEDVGLPYDTPYCDDAVLAACLRVRPAEAGHPATYKPLLAAALDGIVPATILKRTTKDHSGNEWYAGIATHRRTLAAWAGDSRLASAGLADPAALHRALLAPALLAGGCGELENTLGIEEWLRDLDAHPHPHYLKEHASEPAPAATP
ncbi:asparagine synthase-related protein [Streptomyces sp. NPDC052020]|uniref:asparagine synthase-related protein n=1 Tax=Streptomyces sp. NPDC052020 TaxID=3155677 RepID=UPI0034299E47